MGSRRLSEPAVEAKRQERKMETVCEMAPALPGSKRRSGVEGNVPGSKNQSINQSAAIGLLPTDGTGSYVSHHACVPLPPCHR